MSIVASSAAARKLPNRFRTVRSQGLMPAAVHESWVVARRTLRWSVERRRERPHPQDL